MTKEQLKPEKSYGPRVSVIYVTEYLGRTKMILLVIVFLLLCSFYGQGEDVLFLSGRPSIHLHIHV